jgi:hypothetical protein
MKPHFLSLLAIALLAGCSHHEKPFEELSSKERVTYLRNQARQAILTEATNTVPGIHAIVDASYDVYGSEAIVKWTGFASVDYVNHFGGIDRTNLVMKFVANGDQLGAILDYDYYETNAAARIRAAAANR